MPAHVGLEQLESLRVLGAHTRENEVAAIFVASVAKRLTEDFSLHRFELLREKIKLGSDYCDWQIWFLHLANFILNFRHHWNLLPVINEPSMDLLEHVQPLRLQLLELLLRVLLNSTIPVVQ